MPALLAALLAASTAAAADGLVGVDWQPIGASELSTTLAEGAPLPAGGFDAPLTAWGGWAGDHNAWLFGLEASWHRTLSWTGTVDQREDTLQRRLVAALRPALDYRRYLRHRPDAGVQPWLGAGAYLVVPFVRYEDSSLTPEEQAEWDEAAREDRARVLGAGGRLSAGVEHGWSSGLSLGARLDARLHRAQTLDQDTYTSTVQVTTEAALYLSYTL